ncbi:MAG: hypothetical protein WEC15_07690 [Flavobacteriales bacterium]
MFDIRIAAFTALALLCAGTSHAQGGIRAIFFNVEPVSTGINTDFVHYGLGYDHDLNDRLAMGVQMRYSAGATSWVMTYHSHYHFSDNESSSFYMGPNIGFRSVDGSATLIPIGMRMGVRGGLEGFYADLYVGGHYNVGGGGRAVVEEVGATDLRTLSFCGGIDIGIGWGKKKNAW